MVLITIPSIPKVSVELLLDLLKSCTINYIDIKVHFTTSSFGTHDLTPSVYVRSEGGHVQGFKSFEEVKNFLHDREFQVLKIDLNLEYSGSSINLSINILKHEIIQRAKAENERPLSFALLKKERLLGQRGFTKFTDICTDY